ncbi:MAG: glycosyltransferase family 2 protein [Candidatus Omnitrophota bacterium]
MTAEILILNYNGRELLQKCLPSVVEAAQASPVPCAVTVIDNCSSDDSVELLRREFPEVRVRAAVKNLVLCSYNEAVRESRAEIVLLLNNDLRVDKNFVGPLLGAFDNFPDAFFAAPRVLNFETSEYEGSLSKMEFRWGLLWGTARFEGHEEKVLRPALSMQCGFGAFHRKRFMELGGYDDLYLPGTVEDADLCFRGWRRGWKGYYCPDSVVHHIGQATFKREFGAAGIRRLNRRNLYLFVWKNLRSPLLLAQHFLFLPLQFLKYCLFGQFEFVQGFLEALRLLPRALRKRGESSRETAALSDRAVFAISRGI